MSKVTGTAVAVSAIVLGVLGSVAGGVAAVVWLLGSIAAVTMGDTASQAYFVPLVVAVGFSVVGLAAACLPYAAPRLAAILMLVALCGFGWAMSAVSPTGAYSGRIAVPTILMGAAAVASAFIWLARRRVPTSQPQGSP
jgi:hypothetical protein